MSTLADQEARDHIRSDLGTTLVVEAAAGTGKTTELVHRIISLLRHGKTTLARLVAVTFTEKAAGEMKLRLRTEIERVRRDASAEERERFNVALEELEEAHIGTIHGFCAELLRQRPIEARVDPLFEAADDDQQSRLFDVAFDRWFVATLRDPPEGVARVLRRRSRDGGRTGPRDVLRKAGRDLIAQRDFDAAWRRDPFDRRQALDGILQQLAELAALAPLARDREDRFAKGLLEVERFVSELGRREAVRGRDHDGVEEELRRLAGEWFWGWNGRGKWFSDGLSRADALVRRDAVKAALDAVLERVDADLAASLREDLRPLVQSYELRKARAGRLDFLDLLLLARDLIHGHDAVRKELQQRFTHILVDEFQDTDPLQAEILLLLAADDPEERDFSRARPVPGKLFVVGDPKQSIYRFRRADVALYEATKQRLLGLGGKLVHLSTSFRSEPSIQAAINAAFEPRMRGSADGSQAEYVPLQAFRAEPPGKTAQPTLVALPVPRPYGAYGKVTNRAIDESLPDAVGAFVDWLIRGSGWTVTERERPTVPVPIEARHVCLLTRRFVSYGRDVTQGYVRALEARQIPHVLVGGRSFHRREEVIALRNALSAIEWPDDDMSVFAALRGPFFALADDALLAYRSRGGGALRPLHPLLKSDAGSDDDLTGPVRGALDVLARLHVGRNRRPIADTIAQLLDATRAHAAIAIWPTGEQALANLLRLLDHARRFEAAGATSFRAFVQWLDGEAERDGAAEAPVVEEGTDGVRIMTVFKAKGLEFPVVILIDPTCSHIQQRPSRYVDGGRRLWAMPLAGCVPVELVEHADELRRHDMDEAVRVTYVAATRARDLLVVPVVPDEPVPGWVDVLHPALYPKLGDARGPAPAPGCPVFGDDAIVERPHNRGPEDSVAPGEHTPRVGTHHVVWWDANVLGLGAESREGLRHQRILAVDEGGAAAAEGDRSHEVWRSQRVALLEHGSIPAFRIHTATSGEGPEPLATIAISLEATGAAGPTRPHGVRFGTLVHETLATVALEASAEEVLAAARAVGQMLGADTEEVIAAADAVSRALAHPIMRAAASAGACRRETPVLLRAQDGSLVEGVVDLAYRDPEAAGWVVVDYKTDVDLGSRREEYERQVRLYAQAISVAAGEPTRGVLLHV